MVSPIRPLRRELLTRATASNRPDEPDEPARPVTTPFTKLIRAARPSRLCGAGGARLGPSTLRGPSRASEGYPRSGPSELLERRPYDEVRCAADGRV